MTRAARRDEGVTKPDEKSAQIRQRPVVIFVSKGTSIGQTRGLTRRGRRHGYLVSPHVKQVSYSLVSSSSSSDSSDKLSSSDDSSDKLPSLSMYPRSAAVSRVDAVHGQPFARAHFRISRCPSTAANWHVYLSHGQPFARAHCSTSRCPPKAAHEHVFAFHGQPFVRAHCSTSRCPRLAAP